MAKEAYCMNSSSILTIKKSTLDNANVVGTFFVFIYVFSFYIVGPITSSILGAVIVFPVLLKPSARRVLFQTISTRYAVGLLSINILLIALGLSYSILHGTYDLSYIKILFAQAIHIICGFCIVAYLKYKYDIDTSTIIRLIIYAYIIQSGIEMIASANPTIAAMLLPFNKADMAQESSALRGVALASATTWSLGLTYGIAFILYAHQYMMHRMNAKVVIGWFCLVVGTSFAGRTGFLGAIISIVYFLIFSQIGFIKKLSFFGYIIAAIIGLIIIIFTIFPSYVELLVLKILPWALEPLFNLLDGNDFSSASTDRLGEMWEVLPTFQEALLGTGHFTNADGSYYLHTDVGILRNLFYWGVFGYGAIIIYQIVTIYPLFRKGRSYKVLACLILLYIFITEYKAVTIGLNKMTFSILFLLSFFSLRNKREKTT